MIRNQKGITLIALVITIIVLLILAGVSIAMLTGENGILTQATGARDTNEKAAVAEKVNMAIQAAYAQKLQDNSYTPTQLQASDIVTQYNADNKTAENATPAAVTGEANKITVTEKSKTYTVTLTQAGKSFTTTANDISM